MSEGFRTFDHTGDLGLEVWAESRERLFELSAEALMAQIVEVGPAPGPASAAPRSQVAAADRDEHLELSREEHLELSREEHLELSREEHLELTREEHLELTLEGDDWADLFVHWLNTALLEADVRRAVWTRVEVARLEPTSLHAHLEGPRLDPRRLTLLREVKAVSHHHLDLRLDPPSCRARLVLDL
jgi:SHS2 domain-containing protein